MKELVRFSIDRPKLVMLLTVALTVLFALAFPKVVVDTDPENMLEQDQPDRVYYREVEEEFGIHDLLVLGIIDDEGVFRPETLAATSRLIDGILGITGVVTSDVLSLTTTDDVTSADGVLQIRRSFLSRSRSR